GGVTRVIDGVDVLPFVEPYQFSARWDGRAATLSGHAPHRDDLAAITAYARSLHVEVLPAGMSLASGAPDGLSWQRAVRYGLTQLVKLDAGVLTMEDAALHLSGVASAASVREDIERAFSAPPPDLAALEATVEVTVEGAEEPVTALVNSPIQACRRALEDALAGEAVMFYAGSASLAAASDPVLERVAAAAQSCAPLRLRVEAHMGAVGDRAINQTLSQSRAEEVARLLSVAGVEPGRLEALGFGSDRPLPAEAIADPALGDERVEFTVIE
ncbi:MAG: OmpA family protein, partial [Caulobacterales bacterium]|nr:OmpA family protein [Caulobacterales bacterium]